MAKWRNRPTSIKKVKKDVDYIISIDESGTATTKYVDRCIKKGINPNNIKVPDRFLTLSACIIPTENFFSIKDSVMNIKYKYWEDAIFNNKRICFHATDIKNKKKKKGFYFSNYLDFVNELSTLLNKIPITLISTCIDKYNHVKKYKYEYKSPFINPWDPYNVNMKYLLERIVMCVPNGAKSVILFESRNQKDDKNLLDKIKDILDNGTEYMSASKFNKIKGVYFNNKWTDKKDKSYWELELADLYCYAVNNCNQHTSQYDKIFNNIQTKFYQYPNYEGKGLKFFP